VAASDERNLLGDVLSDLARFVKLIAHLAVDQDFSREAIGFPVNESLVPNVTAIADALDAAAAGKAGVPEYVEAAAKLTQVSDAVKLAVEAADADLPPGLLALEAVEALIDTLSLAYVAAHWPGLLFTARWLNLLVENLPPDEVIGGTEAVGAELWSWVRPDFPQYLEVRAWQALSSPLETEDDARRLSASLAVLGMLLAESPTLVDKLWHRTIDPEMFEVLQGWESEPGSTTSTGDAISERFVTLLTRVSGETQDAQGETIEGEAELITTVAFVPKEHGGPGTWLSLAFGAEIDLHLGSGWHLVIEGELDDAVDILIPGFSAPDGTGFVSGGLAAGAKAEVRLERRDEGDEAGQPAQPWRLGGILEVKAAELTLRVTDREPSVAVIAGLRDAALVVERPEDGFFHYLVPTGGLRVNFDLAVIADTTPRVYVEGGAGASVLIPIHTTTSHVQGLHVFLALRGRPEGQTTGPSMTFEASAGFAIQLGPFSATVDRFGVTLPKAPHGLPGAEWVKLPSAVGIGIAGDSVRGGGFLLFDPDRGRYEGVLSLTLGRVTLTAFGLITDLPDGYSLLIVCSLELDPPVQVGPVGLAGLGAIIGHNHGTDVAALQSALRTGAVGTILFPADPVAAAPRVLTTLGNVFPVKAGSSLFGIGLKLSWSGGLVSLSAAVVIESGPTARTIILASLKAVAPDEELALIRLEVDAAGVIDSKRPSVELDGSLVKSSIGPFALTGDAVFRFHGGDDGVFLFAVGGFHPSYTPPPSANVPPQRRLTLAFPTDNPRVRMEQYWAITSNSIQVGARMELSARKGGFSAEAIVGFDALAERNPFHLSVDIEARAAIRYDGSTLASVGLDLHVTGPGPWHVEGKARLELLFFTVSIPVHYTSGPDTSQVQQASADAAAALTAGLTDHASWQTLQPTGAAALVAVRSHAAANGELVVHPAGQLGMRQEVLPLGVDVTHIGSLRVAADRFDIDAEAVTVNGTSADTVTAVRAPFAAGEFVDLSSDERLSRPAFERFVAGITIGADRVLHGPPATADLSYEEIVLGPDGPLEETPPVRPALVGVLTHAVDLGAAAASPLRRDEAAGHLRAAPLVTLSNATRVLVDAATLAAIPGAPAAETETELRQAIAGLGGPAAVLLIQAHEAVG
jgi:hypothetical protein